VKILITGASGQVGMDLKAVLCKENQVFSFNKNQLDVTNLHQVFSTVHSIRPEVIIHAGAYTKVDEAEVNQDLAFRINTFGTRNVTVAAERIRSKVLYISTDYVFDGKKDGSLHEFDQTGPISVYGKSKLAGEEMVKTLTNRYFIVRTSWVYSKNGKNFVKTIQNPSKQKEELFVVNDQLGSPTFSLDLANFIYQLIKTDQFGLYHVSNSGYCTWFEFAKAIIKILNIDTELRPIVSSQFPHLAERPKNSSLDHMAICLNGFPEFRPWKEALKNFLRDI